MVYLVLYSYRQRVRVITLFPNILFVLFLHFQVGVRVFNCQQIFAKISFVIFDNVIKKKNKSNVV